MSDLTKRLRKGAHGLLQKASDLQESIRQRAQAIWEREGRPDGRHEDHWREAEKEIEAEEAARRKSPGSKPRKAKAKVEPASTAAPRNRAKKSARLADAAPAAEVAHTKSVKRGGPTKSADTTTKTAKPRQAAPKKGR